jgi:hypothetical protein
LLPVLFVLQSHHDDLETVLGEIASGRNLPQPQGYQKTAAASEIITDDDTSCPPSPGVSNTEGRRGSRLPTDDLAAFSSEQPTAAAALALLKFHNPGLGLMAGLQAAAAAASSEDSKLKAPAGMPGSASDSPMSAGSSRVSIDFAWGEEPAEVTVVPAASASRDSHVRTDEAAQHAEAPVSSVQQAALAARLRAMGVSNAFAAAGFPAHSSSSHTDIEAQQQQGGQQDDESTQPQDDLTLDDAIAATALLASVFKLGEQQQRLVIGGLLGTGLFAAAAATAGSIDHVTGSRVPQQGQPAALAAMTASGCTLAAQQHSSIKVEEAVQGQELPYKAEAAANFPAAALAADGSLQDSVLAQQQQQCQVSCTARNTTANSMPAKAEEAVQQQAPGGQSSEAAAGHQPMPATAMAFLATLLARQGAAA